MSKIDNFFSEDTDLSSQFYGDKEVFILDFTKLYDYDEDYAIELLNHPLTYHKELEQYICKKTDRKMTLQLINLPVTSPIYELKDKVMKTVVQVEGTVIQRSKPLMHVTKLHFTCKTCGGTEELVIQDEQYRKYPKSPCQVCEGRRWTHDYNKSEFTNYQEIYIQELIENTPNGSSPDKVKIILTGSLIRSCEPGENVKIVGILEAYDQSSKSVNIEVDYHIDATSLINSTDADTISLTEEDKKHIQTLLEQPDHMTKIIQSISPTIYGLETIKEALAYQLCEGQVKYINEERKRGQFHILMAGPPGTGKSELGDFMVKCHPKGRKAIGRGASAVGLCVAADTKIYTDKYGETSIKELVDNHNQEQINIYTINEHGYTGFAKITDFYKIIDPNKNRYKIKTALGYELIGTRNTALMTEKGWRKISQLKEGERVLTTLNIPEHKNNNIILNDILYDSLIIKDKAFIKHAKEIIKKQNKTLRTLSKELGVNENKLYHTWWKCGISVKDAKSILSLTHEKLPQQLLVSPKNSPDSYLLDANDIDLYYLLGIIVGDGNIYKNTIRFYNKDENILSEYIKILDKIGIKHTRKQRLGVPVIHSYSRVLVDMLRNMGMIGNKNGMELKNPREKKYAKPFLQGLFDSDGSVEKKYGRVSISGVSKSYIEEIQKTLLLFKIRSSIRKIKPKIIMFPNGKSYKCKEKYSLNILSDYVDRYWSQINFRCPRKQIALLESKRLRKPINRINDGYYDLIKSITLNDSTELYDLSVLWVNSYIGNNILIHNTASVVKEGEQFVLKAGAMPMADNGFLFIDEIEKMSQSDSGAMHPGMEQQEINIDKADISAVLKTRCSILAACNPLGGIWNDNKYPIQNLNDGEKGLSRTLLDRFALTFIIKQNTDTDLETDVIKHIMRVNSDALTVQPPYDLQMLRKIFAYARSIEVSLTKEVAESLEEFCIVLFEACKTGELAVITRRLPYDLIRLSEASARIHGRTQTILEDGENAKRMVAKSLREYGVDPLTGKVNQMDALYGEPKNKRAMIREAPQIIARLCSHNIDTKKVNRVEFVDYAAKLWRVSLVEVGDILDVLLKDGTVYCPTPYSLAVSQGEPQSLNTLLDTEGSEEHGEQD